MAERAQIDVRDIGRVIFSGTAAYLLVHYFVLPYLIANGVAFPTYFYIGVGATGIFSVVIGTLLCPRDRRDEDPAAMHPAE